MLGLTVLTQAFQAGLLIYGFGVVIMPFATRFDVPRETLMFASTLLALSTNLISPFIGSLVDRRSVSRLMALGAAVLAMGFVMLAYAQAMWQVLAIFALVLPLGNLLLGQLTSATLMARWFERKRGRAMGISAIGTSIGGLLFPPALAALIAAFGQRTAYLVAAAAIVIALIGPILRWVVDRPAAVDQRPDGEALAPRAAAAMPAAAPALTVGQIAKTRRFWQITCVVAFTIGVYLALIANLVPYANDIGIVPQRAAFLLSTAALCAIPGKLVIGALADRIGARLSFFLVIAFTAAALVALLATTTYAGLLLACVLLGLAGGGLLPLWGLLISKAFGQASFGRAAGIMNPAMMPITLLAAPFAGRVFDRTGSYRIAFVTMLFALALSATINAFLHLDREAPSA